MTNQPFAPTLLHPDKFLIQNLIRLYFGSVLFIITLNLLLAFTVQFFAVLSFALSIYLLYRLLPFQHSWFRSPFIRILDDHLLCRGWHDQKISYASVVQVEALPHKSTNLLIQWFLPYWPGSYRLALTLNNGSQTIIDLSPVNHQRRLKFYYLLLQRCGLDDESA